VTPQWGNPWQTGNTKRNLNPRDLGLLAVSSLVAAQFTLQPGAANQNVATDKPKVREPRDRGRSSDPDCDPKPFQFRVQGKGSGSFFSQSAIPRDVDAQTNAPASSTGMQLVRCQAVLHGDSFTPEQPNPSTLTFPRSTSIQRIRLRIRFERRP